MKKCIKCDEVKEITDFYARRRYKDGHSNTCKSCEYNQKKERSEAKKISEQNSCVSTDTYIDQKMNKLRIARKDGDWEKVSSISMDISRLAQELATEKRLNRAQIAIFPKSDIRYRANSQYINMIKDQMNYVVIETNQVPFRTDNIDKIHVLQRRDKIKVLIDLEGFAFDEDIKARMIEKIIAHVSS